MITKTQILLAGAMLCIASSLMAETIVFTDRQAVDEERADLKGETLFNIRYTKRGERTSTSHRPWEVLRFQFDKRNKELEARQGNWNDHLRKYSLDSLGRPALETIPDMLTKTKGLDDLGRSASASAIVWLNAAYIRALSRHGETDKDGLAAFKKAIADWEKAVKEYVPELDRLTEPTSDKAIGGKGHGLATLKPGRVHASAFKVWADVADFYLRAKQYNLAWELSGQIFPDVCAELATGARDDGYLTIIAYPSVNSIAQRVSDAARELDGEAAAAVWKVAEQAYESMVRLAQRMNDSEAEGTARLALADCQIWTGNESKARSVFRRFIDEHKKVIEEGKEKPAKAAFGKNAAPVAALAFNGLGKIAYVQGKFDEALRSFASSTTNFSADKNARAEAVLYSGLCYAKLAAVAGTTKESKKYLTSMADAAMNEVTTVLSETSVFNRRALLANAIAAIPE